jgi:hypothetical protein
MKGQDVWSKGTGVTKFKGSDRYDTAGAGAQSVHSILAEGASLCYASLLCCVDE